MDHTGCLPHVLEATGAERVLASRNGAKALQAHFHGVPGLEAVDDGQAVSLGAAEVLEAGALLVGSPTINNTVFPTVADVLTYLEGLSRQNLVGAAFGSYGWNGKAVGQLQDWLRRMNVELVAEAVKVHYVPDDDALAQCRALGRQVGQALKQRVQSP